MRHHVYFISLIVFSSLGCQSTQSTRKNKTVEYSMSGGGGNNNYSGHELGFFHTPKWESTTSYFTGTNLDAFELGQRFYFGNSFNLKFGIINGKHFEYFKIDPEERLNIDNRYTRVDQVTGASYSLGNRWLYSFAILGIDWIGGYYLISRELDERTNETENPLNQDFLNYENPEDYYEHYVRGYIGISF